MRLGAGTPPGAAECPLVALRLPAARGDEAMRAVSSIAPIGRPARPEEVAQVVHLLASVAASFVNGVGWPVGGGVLAVVSNPVM